MSGYCWMLVAALASQGAWCAELVGSAQAGRQVFETQQCIQCHSINGEGGKSAPDLGKHIARDYTPTTMVALMWNHAPAMWEAIQKAGIERPQLTEQSASDLFAYFVAARFFEQPGDAARGKRDFACCIARVVTVSLPRPRPEPRLSSNGNRSPILSPLRSRCGIMPERWARSSPNTISFGFNSRASS